MKKRILACIVCLCVVLSIAPTIVFAEEERVTSINDNGFRVWSDDRKEFINCTSFTEGNVVVIDQAGTYNVTGSTTSYRIEIRITDETKAGTVTIVLNGATIKPSTPGAAIGVAEKSVKGTNVTIMLSEGSINEVLGYNNAGINNLGRELKIVGNGTLNATGGKDSAGIGGGRDGNGSNITISGNANVKAEGGYGGTGIGGGYHGNGSNITISGNSTINSNGGFSSGAGIGGGSDGNGSNITITDNSTVNAIGAPIGGAGIGGGYNGKGENIKISGSTTVNATGARSGTGIGGGSKGNGENIEIFGNATVEANGGEDSAGIGGGEKGNGSNITISDRAMVKATGSGRGSGIGGGFEGKGENIKIFGNATVKANGGRRRAKINFCLCKDYELNDCSLQSDKNGDLGFFPTCEGTTGIGGGVNGNGSNITISGNPTIQVTSSIINGIGIGNGLGKTYESEITISGGTIITFGCKPFSNTPNLSGYKSPEIWLNDEKYYYPRGDMFIKEARKFEIKPAASVSSSTDVPLASNTSGSTDSSDLMD